MYQQQKDYILSQRQAGFTDEQIKTAMLEAGYTSEQLDEIYKLLDAPAVAVPQAQPADPVTSAEPTIQSSVAQNINPEPQVNTNTATAQSTPAVAETVAEEPLNIEPDKSQVAQAQNQAQTNTEPVVVSGEVKEKPSLVPIIATVAVVLILVILAVIVYFNFM